MSIPRSDFDAGYDAALADAAMLAWFWIHSWTETQ